MFWAKHQFRNFFFLMAHVNRWGLPCSLTKFSTEPWLKLGPIQTQPWGLSQFALLFMAPCAFHGHHASDPWLNIFHMRVYSVVSCCPLLLGPLRTTAPSCFYCLVRLVIKPQCLCSSPGFCTLPSDAGLELHRPHWPFAICLLVWLYQ